MSDAQTNDSEKMILKQTNTLPRAWVFALVSALVAGFFLSLFGLPLGFLRIDLFLHPLALWGPPPHLLQVAFNLENLLIGANSFSTGSFLLLLYFD